MNAPGGEGPGRCQLVPRLALLSLSPSVAFVAVDCLTGLGRHLAGQDDLGNGVVEHLEFPHSCLGGICEHQSTRRLAHRILRCLMSVKTQRQLLAADFIDIWPAVGSDINPKLLDQRLKVSRARPRLPGSFSAARRQEYPPQLQSTLRSWLARRPRLQKAGRLTCC